MTIRRLLAVTHEATITGAPMNLTHLLRWIRDNTDVEVHTLVIQDGPLRPRFEAVGDITVLDRTRSAKMLNIAHRGLLHLGSSRVYKPVAKARLLPQLRALRGFDLVYLNSLPSLAVLPYLPDPPPAVSHVHELAVAIRTWQHTPEYELFRERPQRWIAASAAVRDVLTGEVGLPAERVHLHHEFIEAESIAERTFDPRQAARLRREAEIPASAAVVVGAGTLEWRKGPELFVQLAAEVRRRTRDHVAFVWVGGRLSGTEWERVWSDVERTKADVRFVGMQADPVPWFHLADVFALTSHEDPYPLVCLEAAAAGTPLVTYRNGGMPELLEAAGSEAARGIIDHMDVGAMADHIIELVGDESLRKTAGAQLRARVVEQHDKSVAAPRIFADLQSMVG
jgi:glycosyltransferase involved in cell wall biosynthesis